MIKIIEFPEGLALENVPTDSESLDELLRQLRALYPNNVRTLTIGTHHLQPAAFNFRRNDYKLVAVSNGIGILELLPRYSDAYHEEYGEDMVMVSTGKKRYRIPQSVTLMPLFGPNDNRLVVLWWMLFYEPGKSPTAT